jgi:biopolymer transport protein ExbD
MRASYRPEPNVTPMIDVLLVLIIVFMVMTFKQYRTMDAQLPEPCHGVCPAGETIVLEVLRDGNYRLNQQPIENRFLRERLVMAFDGRPTKVLSVTADADARYGQFFAAMDVARAAGVRVIGVVPKRALPGPRPQLQ